MGFLEKKVDKFCYLGDMLDAMDNVTRHVKNSRICRMACAEARQGYIQGMLDGLVSRKTRKA